MKMQELLDKYNMKPHEENGQYCECHYPYSGEGRAPSGSTYFFLSPGEASMFHQIDCDEYWCYNSGSNLEMWLIGNDGHLQKRRLGLGSDADPVVFSPKGTIFASRNLDPQGEGTFFTCITVPRFDYHGFKLVNQADVIKLCPEAEAFWK